MNPRDEKEAKARVAYVLHEQGYDYFTIPKLTWCEIKDLFRGGAQVEKERVQKMKMRSRH
jgi:hypothetical protein